VLLDLGDEAAMRSALSVMVQQFVKLWANRQRECHEPQGEHQTSGERAANVLVL
jgi:hypothetical protein